MEYSSGIYGNASIIYVWQKYSRYRKIKNSFTKWRLDSGNFT